MKPAGSTHPSNKIKRRVCVRHFCCYYGNGLQSYVRMYLGIPFHAASLPHLSGLNPSSSSRKTLLLVTVLSGLGMMRNLRTVPLLEPRNRTVLFLEGPASVSTTILFNWYLKEKPKQNMVSAAQSCCWKFLFFFFFFKPILNRWVRPIRLALVNINHFKIKKFREGKPLVKISASKPIVRDNRWLARNTWLIGLNPGTIALSERCRVRTEQGCRVLQAASFTFTHGTSSRQPCGGRTDGRRRRRRLHLVPSQPRVRR